MSSGNILRGHAGFKGKSAYDIAVEMGFEGTKEEWLESLTDRSLVKVEKSERKAAIETEKNNRANADNNLQNQINVERERISNLARLSDGSTTADAELIDIRVGNHRNYDTAGESIRQQFRYIENCFSNIKNKYIKNPIPFLYWDILGIDSRNGKETNVTNRITSQFFKIDKNSTFYTDNEDNPFCISKYYLNGTFKETMGYRTSILLTDIDALYRVSVKYNDDRDITDITELSNHFHIQNPYEDMNEYNYKIYVPDKTDFELR